MGKGAMRHFTVGFLTFVSAAVLCGPLAYAQMADAMMKEEKRSVRIDILESENEISDFVVGAVLNENEMLSYCLNISDAATEARNSILQKMMKETEGKIADKLALLEEKTALLEEWVGRRDMFMKNANKSLVSIFETMRPDAAASQLTELNVGLAAAIILKLQPKISSAIMTEIDPKHAAKITSMLTNAIDSGETSGSKGMKKDKKVAEK